MTTIDIPPNTLNVANTVNGNTSAYALSMKMNGAQQKKTRAHTVDENTKIFLRSGDTRSTVHTVNTHSEIDVDIFIAIVGAISNATTCASFTINKRMKYVNYYRLDVNVIASCIEFIYLLVLGINHMK